ncbi:tRNA (adenosine(37)-N6)-dimethylallyltransferase MiaA [Patescibacteria group bacterium]|nr:tRNA (adenosine(37)-N6)-dimethylallyltransferase MiaA [Patescibacteria group bacterium]
MQKLIVILGPTASGKTGLAIRLAKKFQGEIVSADSRQVYKGLDIGTAKPTKRERRSISHHLLDVVSPKKRYTVVRYQKTARKAIQDIQRMGKLPLLVGGSPLYIYAVVDGWVMPKVAPSRKLRVQLEKLTTVQLLNKLKKLDPRRVRTIEQKNRRRLIRALEIVLSTGKPIPQLKKVPLPYPVLFLGISRSSHELKKRIKKRFLKILKQGFLNEIKALRKQGLSWKRIEEFGLEYREVSQYLQGKISKKEMIEIVVKATVDFARRQMTWFKKDPRIHWITNAREADRLISRLLD